jgi:hypothetical protein
MLSGFQRNYTDILNPAGRQSYTKRTFFVASSEDLVTNTSVKSSQDHSKLIFGTLGDEPYMSFTQCSTHMAYINAKVSCYSKGNLAKANCGVDSIRSTLDPTESVNVAVNAVKQISSGVAQQRY